MDDIAPEPEYEEIGPPKARKGIPVPQPVIATGTGNVCNLCSSPRTILSCASCDMQLFCATCDDMYHKHPKRSHHVRKPLTSDGSVPGVPVVEMPAPGPKAPPRRNRKGNKTEPSPAMPRFSTLPKNHSTTLASRPLPPPPPANTKVLTPPPILPKKSSSSAHIGASSNQKLASVISTPNTRGHDQPKGVPMPGSGAGADSNTWTAHKMNINSRYPTSKATGFQSAIMKSGAEKENRFGGTFPRGGAIGMNKEHQYPQTAMPGYPKTSNPGYHGIPAVPMTPSLPHVYPPQVPATPNPAHMYPGSGYPPGGNPYPPTSSYPQGGAYPQMFSPQMGYDRNMVRPHEQAMVERRDVEERWRQDTGHPAGQTSQAGQAGQAGQERWRQETGQESKKLQRKNGKSRFGNKVNRSSSLHDLAKVNSNVEPGGEGVKWKDEVSQANAALSPGMQRTISTKSLHMIGTSGGNGAATDPNLVWNQNLWPPGYNPFQQGFPSVIPGWGQVPPGMRGGMNQVPPGMRGMDGSSWLNWSLAQQDQSKLLRSSSPSNSQKSSVRSKKSVRSLNSNRRSKNARYKDRSRNNSSSQSRNASRNSRKQRNSQLSRSTSTDSDEFYTGESDEEFVSIHSSDTSSRISWTCDFCTYVNNPGTKVCAMCAKTSKPFTGDSLKRDKPGGKKKKKYISSDSDSEKRKPRHRKYLDSDSDREKEKRRRKKEKEKKKKIISDSEDSYIDDAVNTYYAIRVNKNKAQKKTPDSSSESVSGANHLNRPNLTAPPPTKGILKKAISNPSLNRDDGDNGPAFSEAGATMSEVGYITRKMTERLRERGTIISPEIHPKRKEKLPTDMETWSRQKEELKSWAKHQGRSQDSDHSPRMAERLENESKAEPTLDRTNDARAGLESRVNNLEANFAGYRNGGGLGVASGGVPVGDSYRNAGPMADGFRNTANGGPMGENYRNGGFGDGYRNQVADGYRDGSGYRDGGGGYRNPEYPPAGSRAMDYRAGSIEPTLGRLRERMYRTNSGHSLAELELVSRQESLIQQERRPTEQVATGKRNFRSKRFSRNLEQPSLKRAQSFHMDLRNDGVETWQDRNHFPRTTSKNSLHSEHFMGHGDPGVTDNSDAEDHLPPNTLDRSLINRGYKGGYMSGTDPGHPGPDSGYVSHSSGGGYPPLMMPKRNNFKSSTLSIDQGYLGGQHQMINQHKTNRLSGSTSDLARFRSVEDLIHPMSRDKMNFGLNLVKLIMEGEKSGFTSDEVQISMNHCGDGNPVEWLTENWNNMIETVMTLASNVGHEAEENTVGTISKNEARLALCEHKGNIWLSVTECVQGRQNKYEELMGRGNFSREDVITMLTAHQGNIDEAFQELNKVQLRPFLQRIWGKTGDTGSIQGKDGEETSTIAASEHQGEDIEDDQDLAPEDDVESEAEQEEENPEDLEKQRQIRRLLAEGKIDDFNEGELVIRLIEEGGFEEDDCLLAAKQDNDFDNALALLRRDCELCTTPLSMKEAVKLPRCDHFCCKDCAKNYFSVVIKDQNISQCVCPFCQEPANVDDDDEAALKYYSQLDILLKDILEKEVYDLFQRKLRDRTLMKDPNFKWCYKCPFGFLADPKNKKLVCPDCRAMSCAKCLVPWEAQHEGISCNDFARWKAENDPDHQAAGLEQHMAQHGISCPACNFRYTLTKGGCMHFTCTQCKFEFCIGCKNPFKMGARCPKGFICAKMGLHAHHPRNCLFYLRDKEPEALQKLLKTNKVEYDNGGEKGECFVQVQKESGDNLVDGPCAENTEKGTAGYCRIHYIEYLCDLIIKNKLEVISLMELGEVQAMFTRAGKTLPKQRPGEYEFQYKRRLVQIVQEDIPLDSA